MTTDASTIDEPTTARRTWGSTTGPKAILTFGLGVVVWYWIAARGSAGGGAGGITSEGQWLDANGDVTAIPPETYTLVVSPSPLVAAVALLLLAVAWWTRDARGLPLWLSPGSAALGVLVPIAGVVATWLWIRGFEHPWTLGQAIEGPWWASTAVTVDRME